MKGLKIKCLMILAMPFVYVALRNIQHFGSTNEEQYYFYDVGIYLTITYLALIIFVSLKWYDVHLKFASLFFLLISSHELIEEITKNNYEYTNIEAVATAFFISMAIFSIYMLKKWMLYKVQSDDCDQKAGIYVLFNRPKDLYTFFGALFGFGVGSTKFLINDGEKKVIYYMSKKSGVFHRKEIERISSGYICKLLKISPIDELEKMKRDCDGKVGSKYSPFKNNCLTVLRIPLSKYGIIIKTFLPSLFMKFLVSKRG